MKRILNTITTITKRGFAIESHTFYDKFLKFISFWVSTESQKIDDISFGENELGYKNIGYSLDFFIDDKGNLIVVSPIADSFSINSEGELIFVDE